MKALIISEDTSFVDTISQFFKKNDIDTICYKWLLKALDNIEEIAPDIIVLNTSEYPRHWKTLVQFAKSGIGAEKVCVFLYEPTELSNEDYMKAEALNVNGAFSDFTDTTFEEIKNEIHRFFYGETEIEEIPEIKGQYILTNPLNNSFVSGEGILSENHLTCSDINVSNFELNQIIRHISFSYDEKILDFSGEVFSKENNSFVLKLREQNEKQ